jgi:hypothetical protein
MRLLTLAVVAWLAPFCVSSEEPNLPSTEANYWQDLDSWVERGGPESQVQSVVADNCTKLALFPVGTQEWASLLTERQEELEFRIAICVKATVHRVRPQQEFFNPMFVDMICRDSKVALYRKLCIKTNLQSSGNAT